MKLETLTVHLWRIFGSVLGKCRASALLIGAGIGMGSIGCTGFDVLNAPVSSCGYSRTTDIEYGNQPRQALDIYRPRGAAPGARVVMFFYGGDWQAGKKADYRFAADALVSKGFVAVMVDYRLYPQVAFPAFVEDGAKAVRWVKENISRFGGDPSHIYLMGHSAGAHIVMLLTLDARYLKEVGLDRSAICATVGLSGPYDFLPSPDDRPALGMAPNDRAPDPKVEPINFVDGHAPPVLLIHGLKDTTVGADQSTKLAEHIRAAGGEVKLITYPRRGHRGVVIALDWPFRWLAPVLSDAAQFIKQH